MRKHPLLRHALATWEASMTTLKALYVQRDVLREQGASVAEVVRLTQQIKAARTEEIATWQAFREAFDAVTLGDEQAIREQCARAGIVLDPSQVA